MSKVICVIWVCDACLFAREGDGIEIQPEDPKPWSLITEEYSVTLGMLRSEHAEGCKPDDECDCESDQWVTRSCDGCGSPLHGRRTAYTLWSES